MKTAVLLLLLMLTSLVSAQEITPSAVDDYTFDNLAPLTLVLPLASDSVYELRGDNVQVFLRGSTRLYNEAAASAFIAQLENSNAAPVIGNITLAGRAAIRLQQTTADGDEFHLVFALPDGGLGVLNAYGMADTLPTELLTDLATSFTARTAGTRTYRSPNSEVTFQQPLGFSVVEATDNFLIISNTTMNLPVPTKDIPMLPNTYQMLLFTDVALIPDYVAQAGDSLEDVANAYIPPTVCGAELSCPRTAATPFSADPTLTGTRFIQNFPALDASVTVFEVGERRMLLAGYSSPNDIAALTPLLEALIISLQPLTVTIPQVGDTPLTLDTVEVSVPAVWQPLYTGTQPIRLTNSSDQTLDRNEIELIIFPTLADLKRDGAFDSTPPATGDIEAIPLYYSALARLRGADLTGLQTTQIGDRTVAVVAINQGDTPVTELVYTFELDGDFVTVFARVRRGHANEWQPFMADFLTKLRKTE